MSSAAWTTVWILAYWSTLGHTVNATDTEPRGVALDWQFIVIPVEWRIEEEEPNPRAE